MLGAVQTACPSSSRARAHRRLPRGAGGFPGGQNTAERPEGPRPPALQGTGGQPLPPRPSRGFPRAGAPHCTGREAHSPGRPAGTEVCRGHPDGPPLRPLQLVPGSTLGHSLGPTWQRLPRPPGSQALLNCSASSRGLEGQRFLSLPGTGLPSNKGSSGGTMGVTWLWLQRSEASVTRNKAIRGETDL